VCNYHQVVCTPFSGEHSLCVLSLFSPGTSLSNSWRQGFHPLSLTGLPPLTLLKFPGIALKSHRWSQRRRGRSIMLDSSPRPLPSQPVRLGGRW